LLDTVRRVAENGEDATGSIVSVDKRMAIDTVTTIPSDGEIGLRILDMNGVGISTLSEPRSKMIRSVQEPSIAGVSGEENQLTQVDDTGITLSSLSLDVTYLVGKAEALAVQPFFSNTPLDL
jgi:hypothetical protein